MPARLAIQSHTYVSVSHAVGACFNFADRGGIKDLPLHLFQPAAEILVSNHSAYDFRVETNVPTGTMAVGVRKTSCVNDDISSEMPASFQGMLQDIISYNRRRSSTRDANMFCQCRVELLEAE
ncbi:MAG: hypothetical protein FJ211_10770 [Ignavibacteria bacterium]|nr:hypothetical protein [Ignavibacteria bacterium]